MSTDTPTNAPRSVTGYEDDPFNCPTCGAHDFGLTAPWCKHCMTEENARLREELAEVRNALAKSLEWKQQLDFQRERAEQAEARALEYKTEHAALLGTSQWQETEIADLRDDVKRLMQIASECEERALAAEKSHMDLIMQVARKWPNESRHETAKRYIMEAENRPWSGPDQAAVGAKHD